LGVKVTVYTTTYCPYCVRAKRLLERKGVAYEEIDAEHDEALRDWLVEKTGQRTVPQIFVGERSLGGFSDIDALDREGKLDPILRGEEVSAPEGEPHAADVATLTASRGRARTRIRRGSRRRG
jgi:glutaredoxin 3